MFSRKQIILLIFTGIFILITHVYRFIIAPNADVLDAELATPRLEVRYEDSLEPYTPVYESIVSIKPIVGSIGLADYYSDFLCECRTDRDETIYVHISTSDFNQYFDQHRTLYHISTSGITLQHHFAQPRVIHGTVRRTADFFRLATGTSALTAPDQFYSYLLPEIPSEMLLAIESVDPLP